MQPYIAQSLVEGLALALCLVSLVVWIAAFYVWRRDGEILHHVPRRPVPWGPVGLLVAAYFVIQKLVAFLYEPDASSLSSDDAAVAVMTIASVELFATAVGVYLLVKVSRADQHDLGLPGSAADVFADAALGVVAGVAAIVPVYVLLQILVSAFGEIPQNPLLQKLFEEPSNALLVATVVSAVIAAPVFEEFIYRLLIQGWLEKVLGPRATTSQVASGEWEPSAKITSVEQPPAMHDVPNVEPEDILGVPTIPTEVAPEAVPHSTLWLPILISSALFSAAHLGYGYSPVPLFLLAIVLGYIYQRTHRILPCVVVHMVFNGFSVLAAWLEIVERNA